MPINIPAGLPAFSALQQEKIFVMSTERAGKQDIRPLQIAIVNLMPTKIATEIQLLRLLGNSPIQVDITLVHPENHISKNTSVDHLDRFYTTFSNIKNKKFDGMIITGAPVELLDFNEIDYWNELCEIMDYSLNNVFSSLHICWGAQAGLFHHYNIKKYALAEKKFGTFAHKVLGENEPIFRGFDDVFYMPHSRYTFVKQEDVVDCKGLKLLSASDDAGVAIVAAPNKRQFFVTGHFEYDADTLAMEYIRDKAKGLDTAIPENYFPNDNPEAKPVVNWKAHANLFFSNWLNFYVYQETPFELEQIGDV